MKKLINLKNLVGISLILFGTFLAVRNYPTVDNNPILLLDIEKPSDDILLKVKPLSSLITDPTDRAKLAIFNQDFANRITKYTTDNQKVNDVYVLAASYFFKDSLKDKYADLDIELVKLLESIVGTDNHILSPEEKMQISNHFMGLAWSLVQKNK